MRTLGNIANKFDFVGTSCTDAMTFSFFANKLEITSIKPHPPMVITPKTTSVNGIQIRHAYKHKCHWVVAADIAKAMGISTSTLMRFVTPISDDACQILVGAGRARAIRLDILSDAIANLLENNKWQQKLAGDSNLDTAIKQVVAFLEELGQPKAEASSSNDATEQPTEHTTEQPTEQPTEHTTEHTTEHATEQPITPTEVDFMGNKVRFVATPDKPEWVADDIIEILYPHANPSQILQLIAALFDEWKGCKLVTSSNGIQKFTTLYEPGLYRLIACSDNAQAYPYQKRMYETVSISPEIEIKSSVSRSKQHKGKTIDVITPGKHQFIGHIVRFVGTVDELEWVANDTIAAFFPNIDKSEYDQYLGKLDDQWKSNKWIASQEGIEEVATIYTNGVLYLIARSNEVLPLQKWLFENISILDELGTTKPETSAQQNTHANQSIETENAITPTDFDFMGHNIRFVGTPEIPEWVASDAIAILYPNATRNSYRGYLSKIPSEWKGVKRINTPGGAQKATTLYEPGLYHLMGRSDSPVAIPFQKWVNEDVLPSIRKTGSYKALSSTATNELPPITDDTFTDMTEFARLTRELINTTNSPLPLKSLYFTRSMRTKFPEHKEFNVLYEAMTYQDLTQFEEELTFQTCYCPVGLARIYSTKHELTSAIDRRTIYVALVKNKLIEKNDDGHYVPTELGKSYGFVGWHKNKSGKLVPVIQWRQEVLLLLGKLH